MATLIGITAGEIDNKIDPWSPITYGQSRTYSDAIIAAGGTPLILPITDDTQALRAMYDNVNGILFAGGNDVNPDLYHQKAYAETKDISPLRDSYEIQLMKWALEDNKPILAICRGMQLLNIVSGGDLYQHIPSDLPDAEDHNMSTSMKDAHHLAHTLKIEPSSALARALNTSSIKTNTHHHQAVHVLGEGLQAVAWAEDGLIEGIEGKGRYVIGVQSHPESLVEQSEESWINLFKSFVEEAAR